MPQIPQTTDYLILGLVVVFAILGLFVASLVIRYRNLEKDVQLIEKLSEEP